DHQLMLEAIRLALADTTEIEIVGEATSGSQALPLVNQTQPDAILGVDPVPLTPPRLGLQARKGVGGGEDETAVSAGVPSGGGAARAVDAKADRAGGARARGRGRDAAELGASGGGRRGRA